MANDRQFGPVSFLPGDNRGRYPFCHSLYLPEAGILVDPASDRNRLRELREAGAVEAVWLSHWHEDHFMHLDLFDGIPLAVSEDDAPPLGDMEVLLDWYGLAGGEEKAFWRAFLRDVFHYGPRRPDRFLVPGQVLSLGSVTVEVLAAPGHTPGHAALFFREPEILFLGDYDLTAFGPWYGDRDSSIEETVASLRRLREIPARVWLTSHDTGVFTDPPGDLWDRYAGVIDRREAELLAFLREPRTFSEIVHRWIAYRKPREPLAFYAFAEGALMRKHLERLEAAGAVLSTPEGYVQT